MASAEHSSHRCPMHGAEQQSGQDSFRPRAETGAVSSSESGDQHLAECPECPAGHGAAAQTAPPAARCPFQHAGKTAAATSQAAAAGCPVHAGTAPAGDGEETDDKPASDAEQKPLECPMGFGGSNTAKLNPLHCILCRALYFDAAVTACGHRFCCFCITPFHDCPLCGADCQPLSEDDDMQGTVDKYIEVHSADHKLVGQELAAPVEGAADQSPPERTKASFMLQLGLRSLAGGNLKAALHRFAASEELLRSLQQQIGSAASDEDDKGVSGAQLSIELGAVCGSQGDCHRRLGDSQQALRKYQDSVQCLERCTDAVDEAKHALSVSYNKLGDLSHWSRDLQTARSCYTKALALRRKLLEGRQASAEVDDGIAGLQLDLAVSLIKVTDVETAIDENSDVVYMLGNAEQLAEEVALSNITDEAVAAKLKAVQAYLSAAKQNRA